MTELLPLDYEILRRSFDDLRYGHLSRYPLVGLGSLSEFDPSRAPAGHATVHVWDYVPYRRIDGRNWDDSKRDYAERMISHMAGFLANLTDENILAFHCDSPLDMERTSPSFLGGDLHGIAMQPYQLGGHRPTPALAQFTVPNIARLYLVGAFSAPWRRCFWCRSGGRTTIPRGPEDRFFQPPTLTRTISRRRRATSPHQWKSAGQ